MRRGRHPRGICPVCRREYAMGWVAGWYAMRRHGWPDICDGTHCEPERVTLSYHEAKRGGS